MTCSTKVEEQSEQMRLLMDVSLVRGETSSWDFSFFVINRIPACNVRFDRPAETLIHKRRQSRSVLEKYGKTTNENILYSDFKAKAAVYNIKTVSQDSHKTKREFD